MTGVKRPTETKVVAATGGAAGGGVVAGFIVWLLGITIWGAPWDAAHESSALAAVPLVVAVLVTSAVGAVSAYIAGRRAPHTPRPDLVEHPLTPRRSRVPDEFVTQPLPVVPSGRGSLSDDLLGER